MDVGVFVLGMHRSGTSAVTRLINLLGVAAPRESDLVPANEKNRRGYWESMSLVQFNTRVLAAVDCDMSCPIALERGWERDARLDRARAEADQAVRWAFPTAPWVWKDPRNCLSFAFWRATLDIKPVAVVVHRNPLEIVASALRARPERKIYILALWERYLRQALAQIEGLPVRVTSYGSVLADPLAWCEETRAFLGRAGVNVEEASEEQVLDFVDSDLRHAAFSVPAFLEDLEVSDAQRALFLRLTELAGHHDEFSTPALPPETPTTEILLAERRRAALTRYEQQRALWVRIARGALRRTGVRGLTVAI